MIDFEALNKWKQNIPTVPAKCFDFFSVSEIQTQKELNKILQENLNADFTEDAIQYLKKKGLEILGMDSGEILKEISNTDRFVVKGFHIEIMDRENDLKSFLSLVLSKNGNGPKFTPIGAKKLKMKLKNL